jgi:hypothetical protein
MKTLIALITLALLLSGRYAVGAIPGGSALNSTEYVFPDDSLSSTTRGSFRVCDSRGGGVGKKGLSFMQLENAACPVEPRKAVGWDRPEAEPVSPGIPFQNQGIDRN